jgi:pyruvate formate lyase activating enzyme
MTFAGWQRTSLIDFPGKVAAVVFTGGCNLRCPFCHNPELVSGCGPDGVSAETVLAHLAARLGKLDALVVGGGEPLLQAGLPAFLGRVKALGYPVKLDTNGTFPEALDGLLRAGLVDHIAMDIKAPPEKYSLLAGVGVDPATILRSIRLIEASGVAHQFRTTVVRPLLDAHDLETIAGLLADPRQYRLQAFVRGRILDPSLPESPQFSEAELGSIAAAWR